MLLDKPCNTVAGQRPIMLNISVSPPAWSSFKREKEAISRSASMVSAVGWSTSEASGFVDHSNTLGDRTWSETSFLWRANLASMVKN